MEIDFKRRVFESCILSSHLYGAQIWALTKKAKYRLGIAQAAMDRAMSGIKKCQKIRKTEIKMTIGVFDVVSEALALK